MTLASKLDPAHFPNLSPLMAAITGYVLHGRWTKPEIAEIAISEREDLVYLRTENYAGYNTILNVRDSRWNWAGLLGARGLTPEDRVQVERFVGGGVRPVS